MSNTKENENEEPEQEMSNAVNEEAKPVNEQVKEHNDSPHSMPVVEDNPVSLYSGNPPLETYTNTAPDDKNIQSESSPDQDPPSVSLDRDKGSLKPDTESSTDNKNRSVRPDTKSSVKPDTESSTDNENMSVRPDTKLSTDHEKRSFKPDTEASMDHDNGLVKPDTETSIDHDKGSVKPDTNTLTNIKIEAVPGSKTGSDANDDSNGFMNHPEADELAADTKIEASSELPESKAGGGADSAPEKHRDPEPAMHHATSSDINSEKDKRGDLRNGVNKTDLATLAFNGNLKHSFLWDGNNMSEGSESGTEEEQSAFMKELENFFRERTVEFKPPKFYGEGLNCLKLWRAVTRLGGYEKVTSCKLWRQVGESFKPPKTCTTVSWTFRGFYEKALLDYERHKALGGELNIPIASPSEPMNGDNLASGSGRARRDAAARAMQGWHSQRLLGNGEVTDPIIKDRNSISLQKREKQLKSLGLLKRKKPSYMEHAVKAACTNASKPQLDTEVVDVGPPADWVKINVQKTKDCFEVYALVPGLLREEVRVQSDPAGRLVISGEPEQPDNPWGVTPFKKVVSLSSRIDPHQTSAVVTLHGQLFVRVPFEQSD